MRHTHLKDLLRRGLALLGTAAAVGCSSKDQSTTEPGAIALVLLPASASIAQGGSTTVAATLTRSGGFTGTVNLAVSGQPTGVIGVASNLQTTGLVTTAIVTISANAAAAPGSYILVVHGTGNGVTEATATLALTVTQLAAPCLVGGGPCEQWASSATASSEYTATNWSARQATGQPDVPGCADDERAWASLAADGVDWLELAYPEYVRPTEIRVHEVLAVSSIVKVEVKDASGTYHTVYTAQPGSQTCPRVLTIPVTGVSAMVRAVRVSLDQRTLNYWNEIDAVKLIGNP